MAWHSAKGQAVRTDRTSLPGRANAPHGSSVIIFTTAAIQQCRINSVRYCGPGRTGPQGDPRESQPLLNLSIAPRIRRFRPLFQFIVLSRPSCRAFRSLTFLRLSIRCCIAKARCIEHFFNSVIVTLSNLFAVNLMLRNLIVVDAS